MNIFRPQKPYEFFPPKCSPWFRPVLHVLSALQLRHPFHIRRIQVRGAEALTRLVREGHSVLVTPNHADHADPALLVHVGRREGCTFNFMAAREGFERSRLRRFVLQRSGAFSVDREGADLAAIRTAMNILRECRYPLVIFKLEEDILVQERYPAPRDAEITFGEPIDALRFLRERSLNSKTGVRAMTELLRERIQALLPSAGPEGWSDMRQPEPASTLLHPGSDRQSKPLRSQ